MRQVVCRDRGAIYWALSEAGWWLVVVRGDWALMRSGDGK